MNNKLDKIVVVGQGAIGLLWYHYLSQKSDGNNVSLLASNQDKLTKEQLASASYQFTAYQQDSAEDYPLIYSQETDIHSADIIILCLKSFHIVRAIKNIAKYINSHCLIILAHNGMGTFEAVVNALPQEQITLAMLTTHGCLRSAPLTVIHTGLGQSDIGLLSGELNCYQQEQLTKQLNHALPQVTFHQKIVQKQWLKLAINCVINPITAINDIDNGEINDPQYTQQIDSLLAEIIKISEAENITMSLTDLKKLVGNVAQATAINCSSMRCDVLAGKSTEIDYINGYIHRLGIKHDIATPENTRLWQQILNLKKA